MTSFTPHQDSALKAVADWLKAKPGKNGTPPVFRLFGYAGTGKTTLARHVAEGVEGEVKFAAFTGKAALVMRNKGCDNASTIHSLIYRARESGVEQPSFELWDDAPASKAKLIVIDECSMVDAELGRDLLSFDCPLLVLGDPAQLPPIAGRRLLHRRRARCDADGSASPGAERSDRADVDGYPRGPHARDRPPRRERGDLAQGARSGTGDADRPGAGRAQQHPPRLQHADPAKAAHRGALAGRRRQARLPAQQPQEGPVQRRAVAGEVARAVEIEDRHHARLARRGTSVTR